MVRELSKETKRGTLKGMLVHLPYQHQATGTPFGDLAGEPELLARVRRAFTRALAKSFDQDAAVCGVDFARRMNTDTERRRRAQLLATLYRRMRGDWGWSVQRTIDTLAEALRVELDGGTYERPRGRLWLAGDN